MGGRRNAIMGAALIAAALLFSAGDANAIIEGHPSGLHAHMVRVDSGASHCSGVAIGRQAVVTAAHCAGRPSVNADGQRIAVSHVTRSAVVDGRRVSVAGDAAILMLREPLPGSISPLPIGDPGGGEYTVAGFGTATEAQRMAIGTLREARLVEAARFALVDPNRTGNIGASACYGDSGGAVLRGGMLVGIITRASHPHPRIACGYLTRWAPVSASGAPVAVAAFPSANAYPDSPYAAPFAVAAAEKTAVRKAKKGKRKKFRKKRRRG